MTIMWKTGKAAAIVGVLSSAVLFASAPGAGAASDSYTANSFEIGADNYAGGSAFICNNNSGATDVYFWITDAATNQTIANYGRIWVPVGEPCNIYTWDVNGDPIQVWFRDNGITYGTDPIPYN